MSFVTRATNLLTQPKPELARAASEPTTTAGLFTGYAAILALLPAIGALLALLLFAGSAISYFLGQTLVLLVLTYLVRDLGLTFGIGLLINALAANFGGQKNSLNAMKLAVYAATPIWIAGFLFALLAFALGGIGYLILLLGFGFAGYIIYLGCGPLLGVPQNQAPVLAGILTVVWLVLYIVVERLLSNLFLSMLFGSAVPGLY